MQKRSASLASRMHCNKTGKIDGHSRLTSHHERSMRTGFVGVRPISSNLVLHGVEFTCNSQPEKRLKSPKEIGPWWPSRLESDRNPKEIILWLNSIEIACPHSTSSSLFVSWDTRFVFHLHAPITICPRWLFGATLQLLKKKPLVLWRSWDQITKTKVKQ